MGILDDAGVEPVDVPKDPFGFGNDYWPVTILECNAPKLKDEYGNVIQQDPSVRAGVSSSGKSYGTMMVFAVLDSRFEWMGGGTGQLGFGQWFQLPPPKAIQNQVPFDKNSPDGRKILHSWGTLLKGLGFAADEMAKVGLQDIIGRECSAKIFAKEEENGFYSFRVMSWKPVTAKSSGEGESEFTRGGTSNPSGGLSGIEAALQADIDNA